MLYKDSTWNFIIFEFVVDAIFLWGITPLTQLNLTSTISHICYNLQAVILTHAKKMSYIQKLTLH